VNRKLSILVALAAGVVTALVVAGLSAAASPPVNTSPPTIGGPSATVGVTLTASKGGWTGAKPITYAYQWLRCDAKGAGCSGIGGATESTYQLKNGDAGHTIRVRVTAKNSDGTATATSAQTDVVQKKAGGGGGGGGGTTVNGCPTGTGVINITGLTTPAQLSIDGQQASPTVVTPSTADLTLRFHVSACNGRSVQGALVYATAVPFEQFSIPPEAATGPDGWASLTLHKAARFPASSRQQLLAVFVRARKSGESLLGGVSARRLVSFPVRLH
jgi:hypothetical protein